MEQAEWVARLRQGDQKAMEALLEQYGAMIRYVIRGILSDSQEQEDCYSEVCLLIWQKITAFDEKRGSLRLWLTVLSRNAARNRRLAWDREQCRRSETTADEIDWHTPEAALLQQEQSEELHRALAALSLADRRLFYRKYYYLQSTAQIAAEYGTTERAIEGRLYRIRKRLQKYLGGD